MGRLMPSNRPKATTVSLPRASEGACRELIRTFGLVERVMQPYFARFGISGSQWGVLRRLHQAEQNGVGSLRLTDLSDQLLIRPPSVTGVVDRLQRAGLVVRAGSPTDLRSKQVALTPRGRELLERVLAVHARQMDCVMGSLTAEEQAELHHLLAKLGRHLETLVLRGGNGEES